ncbi:MAG: hypothetical protein VYE08_07515, partial [Candidatus Thermoplasmatota archaeon]|nr:hypothetical protein [Candidatus Thermoplasmatota archaeon]
GELQRVLRSLGWWSDGEHTMILGSRTDAGVNVRRNGGLLTLDRELYEKIGDRKLVRAMADRLPDHLAVLDAIEVPEGWNPRLADHRVYRYRLEGMEGWWADDLERFQRHLDLFVGTHDVRNFARMEEGKNPIRTVVSASPWSVGGRIVGFEIVGHSFLWNQVRRIAMAVHSMELGRLSEDEVRDALERPEVPVDFGVAPAEWLILWDVVWDALPSVESPERAMTWQPSPTRAEGAERTMRRRWSAAASAEIEALLHHEWSALGRLHWS